MQGRPENPKVSAACCSAQTSHILHIEYDEEVGGHSRRHVLDLVAFIGLLGATSY